MQLSAGTRLGPYEIQAPLGAGGIDEVYRARDTRLARTVAIKVSRERANLIFFSAISVLLNDNRSVPCLAHPRGPVLSRDSHGAVLPRHPQPLAGPLQSRLRI
jgi:hypothetical protein